MSFLNCVSQYSNTAKDIVPSLSRVGSEKRCSYTRVLAMLSLGLSRHWLFVYTLVAPITNTIRIIFIHSSGGEDREKKAVKTA